MECRFCGRATEIVVGNMPICEECYERAGSCCLEFGGDDLWQQQQEEATPQDSGPGGTPGHEVT
jgi:hypothetical protein